MLDSFAKLTLTHENDAEVVVGLGIVGLELDRPLEVLDSFGQLALPGKQNAQASVPIRIVWLELDGPLEVFRGVGEFASFEPHHTEIVEGDRGVRVNRESLGP